MIRLSDDETELICMGQWTLSRIDCLYRELKTLSLKSVQRLNLTGIVRVDTAGAACLHDLIKQLNRNKTDSIDVFGLDNRFKRVFALASSKTLFLPVERPLSFNFLSLLGQRVCRQYHRLLSLLAFVGELFLVTLRNIQHPGRIQWKAVVEVLDETGYRALPIIALMSFLIGVVLVYQLTTELQKYGAAVFLVDVSGVAILREFAPLITAIIMAGRTSTAFTAFIGMMKVNEEIDALRTMGIAPLAYLVLPRLAGLLIALPLLTVWANLFGILGSMLMAKWMVNLSYLAYLERFRQVVSINHFILGISKAPIFAIVIAIVGCFQGLTTASSADSVGWQTTKSAVQALFLIIIADAGFSVLFSMVGL